MVETGWVTCRCGQEYFIKHIKYPTVDRGDSLKCPSCGYELARWGKGTDDYLLITKEQLERQLAEEAKAPRCSCGVKMVLRSGPYGSFYGCANYPDGCNETKPYFKY
jgi:DNA-directed RNA polymerase subunit RPC12/RpoP